MPAILKAGKRSPLRGRFLYALFFSAGWRLFAGDLKLWALPSGIGLYPALVKEMS
jgi:hypothetical protein